jgi:hypothetical protein
MSFSWPHVKLSNYLVWVFPNPTQAQQESKFKETIILGSDKAYIHDMPIDIINGFLCYSPHRVCLTTASLSICEYGCCNVRYDKNEYSIQKQS